MVPDRFIGKVICKCIKSVKKEILFKPAKYTLQKFIDENLCISNRQKMFQYTHYKRLYETIFQSVDFLEKCKQQPVDIRFMLSNYLHFSS